MAFRVDKRNIFVLLLSKIKDKIEITDIILNKEIKTLLLSKYFLYLLIDFWLNAFFFSDVIISHKSHNNGKLKFVVIISVTLSSKLVVYIVRYYLNKLTELENKFKLISEIHREFIFLKISQKFQKEILIRAIAFFVFTIGFIVYAFYYLLIFCTVFRKSQISLMVNYIVSMIEDLLYGLGFVSIIIGLRRLSLFFENKYIYNISKFIDNIL